MVVRLGGGEGRSGGGGGVVRLGGGEGVAEYAQCPLYPLVICTVY